MTQMKFEEEHDEPANSFSLSVISSKTMTVMMEMMMVEVMA